MEPEIENIDDAAYVRALAHPLRLRILAMLRERPNSPARLAARLGVRVNVVAYHVKRLHQLGLAELVEVRRGRGGLEHMYAVRSRPALTDDAWAELEPETRRRVLAAVLRQVGDYVNGAALAGRIRPPRGASESNSDPRGRGRVARARGVRDGLAPDCRRDRARGR